MFCSKCGARLTEGTSFCSVCGTPVSGPPIAAAPPAYSTSEIAPAGTAPIYPTSPAAIALPSPYAGFWLRVVAYLIDGIVLGVIFGILFLIGIAIVGAGSVETMVRGMHNGGDAEPPVAFILMFVFVGFLSLIASWIYHAYLESSPNQGTLGKMALGLIVTDSQGRRISFGHATGRFFAKIITSMIPLGIGYMMAGFTEKKQALHDMIAATLVLRKN